MKGRTSLWFALLFGLVCAACGDGATATTAPAAVAAPSTTAIQATTAPAAIATSVPTQASTTLPVTTALIVTSLPATNTPSAGAAGVIAAMTKVAATANARVTLNPYATSSVASDRQNPNSADNLCKVITYTSNGAPVKADLCQPAGDTTNLPAVIFLHGSGGALPRNGLPGQTPDPDAAPLMARFAGGIATQGYVSLSIDYFSQTPLPPGITDYDEVPGALPIKTWTQEVADGLAFLKSQPRVAPNKIALVGWSLGGLVAIERAATDPAYKAVVSLSGLPPDDFAQKAAKMPPMLIMLGTYDQFFPVKVVNGMRDAMQAANRPHEELIETGANHFWEGQYGRDGFARVLAFFQKYL